MIWSKYPAYPSVACCMLEYAFASADVCCLLEMVVDCSVASCSAIHFC